MTSKDIEKTLSFRLSEYLEVYPIDVDYPSVAYAPQEGTPYLKIDYLHGESFGITLGECSPDRAVGVYQITVNVPGNQGQREASTIIEHLKEYFKRGTGVVHDENKVRITSFYLGSYQDDPDWYREVINIAFRSDILN